MSKDTEIICEDDLHAYVDGQLPPEDRARVETWLQAHQNDAARVQAWQAQNRDIRALFADSAETLPGDDALVARPPHRPWLTYATAIAAAFILFASGVFSARHIPFAAPAAGPQLALSGEASTAFLVYASDVRHPVEVGVDEKDHLVTWLGKRVGKSFPAPDLAKFGFNLIGGRLVPVDGNPGALLMYEDLSGKRLTVLVGRGGDARDTAFQFAANGSVETFYWIDQQLAYAVTGEVSRETLRQIADECYRQFQI